jgi:hypothetical protein
MPNSCTRHSLFAGVLAAALASASAQDATVALPVAGGPESVFSPHYDLTVLHVNKPGHPTNVVPGLGIAFRAGGTSTSAFERPWISANGVHFAINVVAASSTADDDVLLLNGAVLLREGDAAPWAAGQTVGPINPDFGINDAGSVLLNNNVAPATTLDDYLVLWSGGSWSVIAQEGGATPVGGTWSSTIDSAALANNGAMFWRATTIAGLPTASNALVALGGSGAVLQKGVDVPLAQAGGGTATWENFTTNRVNVSPDGSLYLVVGDTNAATTVDAVLTLNNIVMIQEGQVLPGSSFPSPVSSITKAWFDRGGNWYARGSNANADDWLVRNGVLIADSSGSSEVVPGSGEFFDDATYAPCFFCFDGNSLGQFVFGGVTNAVATANGVLVFDDGQGFRRVVARESDPVDLDGNGLFDDDRFFNTFGDDDVLLLDDGTIVFTATLKNGAGTAVDQGLFRLDPKPASCTFRNGTGVNPAVCSCSTLPFLGSPWTVTVAPDANTLFTFAYAADAAFGPFPLFGGELLIAPGAIGLPGNVTHTVPLPASMRFLGAQLFVQGLRLQLVGTELALELTNAQDVVVGL